MLVMITWLSKTVRLHYQTAESVAAIQRAVLDGRHKFIFHAEPWTEILESRNFIAARFLQSDADILVGIDNDFGVTREAFDMHARYGMLHQALVEGGSAYVHRPPRISHYLGTAKPWHDFDVDDLAQDFAAVRQRAIKALEAAGSGAGGRMRHAGALPQSRFGATHAAQPRRRRTAPQRTDRRHRSSRGASCTHS